MARLVAMSVTAVDAGATTVRLVLRDSDDALTAAVALAQREKECCAFFDVSIALTRTGARSSWPCPTAPRRHSPRSSPCSASADGLRR